MTQFRVMPAAKCITCIAGILIASLISHEYLHLTTASAELITADPSDANPTQRTSRNEFPTWKHNAWEHWGSQMLDPQNFPYSVVFIGDKLQNIQKDDISAAIKQSINTWNDVTCAAESLQFGGFRSTLDDVSANEIPIFIPAADYWNDQKSLIASTNMNNPAIALNISHFTWALEPAPFQYLPQNIAITTPPDPRIVDLQSVITHELGHILGLWHTHDDATATMTAKYLPDASQRLLAADDKFALCHLVPKPGSEHECSLDTDCPQGPCVSDGTFSVCQKSQANPGDFCALDLLHCPHGCIIDSPSTGTGYCTDHCQIDTDCPTHFQCISVENQNTCRLVRPEESQNPGAQTSCSTLTHSPTNPNVFVHLLAIISTSLWSRKTINARRRKNDNPKF